MHEPSQWRVAIIEFIKQNARPPDKFSHQARLYQLAATLAEGRSFDDDVVFAGAWLHDLGVFIGHRPEDPKSLRTWDHIGYALEKTPDILKRFGFPEKKVAHVLEVIRTHMPMCEPASFEAILVRDADILEQLGAVGILRTASKVGRDTRFALFSDATQALSRNLNELPVKLKLESSRRLAAAKVETLRAFLRACAEEAAGIEW